MRLKTAIHCGCDNHPKTIRAFNYYDAILINFNILIIR